MRFRAAGQKKELNKRANLDSVKEQTTGQQKQADNGTVATLSVPGHWPRESSRGLSKSVTN